MLQSVRRGFVLLVAFTLLLLAAATPVSAGGFAVRTVEEIGEGTATCDFNGDGIFTDYEVVPASTVLVNVVEEVVEDDYGHQKRILKFDELEYTSVTADPDRVFFTANAINDTVLDGNTLTIKLRGSMTITDESGNVLFRGNFGGDIELLLQGDEEPLVVSKRYVGTPGNPCGFGA